LWLEKKKNPCGRSAPGTGGTRSRGNRLPIKSAPTSSGKLARFTSLGTVGHRREEPRGENLRRPPGHPSRGAFFSDITRGAKILLPLVTKGGVQGAVVQQAHSPVIGFWATSRNSAASQLELLAVENRTLTMGQNGCVEFFPTGADHRSLQTKGKRGRLTSISGPRSHNDGFGKKNMRAQRPESPQDWKGMEKSAFRSSFQRNTKNCFGARFISAHHWRVPRGGGGDPGRRKEKKKQRKRRKRRKREKGEWQQGGKFRGGSCFGKSGFPPRTASKGGGLGKNFSGGVLPSRAGGPPGRRSG